MMRIVFLLFAEERKLLPADEELYASTYSVGRLCAELEQRVIEGSEEDLEHSFAAWHRLLAVFNAVYYGIDHPRLTLHAHDGSLFDPNAFPWLPLTIDDRTVLHMLRAVQYVWVGTGRSRERRTLSFRSLDVEQIGYVYEGLLSFDGFRAEDVTVGLIGKEGLEEEVPLTDLEALAAQASDVEELATLIATKYKESGIGSPAALAKKLAPMEATEQEEARKKLLAVTDGDLRLAERLLPFYGLLRMDLRGLPMVILPGALYVTESRLRKNTGTHYTPRFLAEQVVEGALEPLVYEPGPLQTADKSQWKLKSSREILSLKVADIAMGSAAFLVAAARYLAKRLIEAWEKEGDERARAYRARATGDQVLDADVDPLVIEARRQVIEHCLYGVDINPMAVEMAKLSLWLISMDPQRPFTFLDDRLVCGDSLLGITSLDQLEYMHLDPKRGRELHEGAIWDWTAGVRSLVAEVAEDRRAISNIGVTEDGMAALAKKRELLATATAKTERLRLFADLLVGAALANAKRGQSGLDTASVEAARLVDKVATGQITTSETKEQREKWLATDHVAGTFDRHPLHWPLVFPEVFERGGFDAIICNPPFLGGSKISGSSGSAYREHLVNAVAEGARGNADLVAYFALRAHSILRGSGQLGLIATNTLAQGDTREVGLDRLVARGATIRMSIKSAPWPSKSAALEYCAVWMSLARLGSDATRLADGVAVAGISPALDPLARVTGNPKRLRASQGIAFNATKVTGLGFLLTPDEAHALIRKDHRNSEILFPYLTGEDLNSRPDSSASRWVIDFRDWPRERAETYPDCFSIVLERVKPERYKNNNPTLRDLWWRFERRRPEMLKAIAGLERVIVITLVSKTVMPVMVPTGQVFSHALGVFATDDTAMLVLLSSSLHYWWAVSRASSMRTDLRYTPSDVFETFPLPELTAEMRQLGDRLDTYRRDVMLSRQAGLTATYNMVFDPECRDEDIVELRRIHREIDEAVCRAYGWDDLVEQGLDHGFHKAGAYTRYTIGPAVKQEILDRLLELNHERYAAEVAAGLHEKGATKRGRKAAVQTSLF
jgi:hypothetical protein